MPIGFQALPSNRSSRAIPHDLALSRLVGLQSSVCFGGSMIHDRCPSKLTIKYWSSSLPSTGPRMRWAE